MSEIRDWVLYLSLLVASLSCKFPAASSSSSTSLGFSRSSVLQDIRKENEGDLRDFAVDLNATSFNVVLRETPATFAVVEFFASWCPACRQYKPQYEKVARLFNGPDAVHPGIVLMTRVDCAQKINSELCDKFSISHYPMLFWGAPSKFVSGSWDPKKDKSEIRPIENPRTAALLLDFINKQMGSSYTLDDEKFENEHLQSNFSDPGQIARAVYDIEEATHTAFDIIFQHKMIIPETRAPLIKFLQLLVAHHPSRRCRNGIAELLVNYDELFPTVILPESGLEDNDRKQILQTLQICGKDVPRGYWMFCRGSTNETRGFSCGLWVLLHSLSVRIEDAESQFLFTATCDFIHNFFVCEECRQHFYQMCSSVSTPFNKARDYAIWLWTAHNKVNERLMKEEADLKTGDPKYPKVIWPPKQLCAACYLGHNQQNNEIEWNLNEVYKFLIYYYGRTLVSLQKEKSVLLNEILVGALEDSVTSGNAVAVPVGAALAIALASCAFGALACFWRSRQKSRKYYRQPHFLKNI